MNGKLYAFYALKILEHRRESGAGNPGVALTAYAIMEGAKALGREMRKENKKNGATANRTGYCKRTDCA